MATVLLVLGGISSIANKPQDNIRVYLVATVFTVAAKNLGGFAVVGADLANIFGSVAIAATGAAAVSAVMAIVNMTRAAFAGAGQPAMTAAPAN